MTPATPGRVVLVHWKPVDVASDIESLKAKGLDVTVTAHPREALHALRDAPSGVLVVDLSRLPSHGREVARSARESKATRGVPLVFVGGEADKVERARQMFPDAECVTWRGLAGAIARAARRPRSAAVVPSERVTGYSGTPLPKKLGIKAGALVGVVGAPDGFGATLGELPERARVTSGNAASAALTIWFVRRQRDFVRALPQMMEAAARGPLWIAWPKQASPLAEDLSQAFVRDHAIAAGLVDYKVCAIDADWSALAFSVKRSRS